MQQISKSKNKLQIKELQRFFNKITNLILFPKDSPNALLPGRPALIMIMKEQDFINAKDYNINKTIADLLDDKYPVLQIKINEQTFKVEYSIKDEKSGLSFILKTLDVTQSLANFLQTTHWTEKIPMFLVGEKEDKTFFTEEDITNNVMLIIDGYYLERIR
jgi:hypothetical protein